jgi:hypothetical protein
MIIEVAFLLISKEVKGGHTMELYSKFRQFLDLKKIVNTESSKIFRLIIEEVERQDKKLLLFPPVTDTLSVKWLVMVPVPDDCFAGHYYYLALTIQPDQETDEVSLVLSSLWEPMPHEVFLEVFRQTPKAMRKNAREITKEDIARVIADMPKEMPEDLEEDETDEYYDWDPSELGRFPLNGVNPTVLAKKIITEGRKIFEMKKLSLAKTPEVVPDDIDATSMAKIIITVARKVCKKEKLRLAKTPKADSR